MDFAKTSDRPLAIITSASSGIGYEMAKQFAHHEFDLILLCTNPAVIETAQICQRLGIEAECLIIDMTKMDAANDLINKITAFNRVIDSITVVFTENNSQNEMDLYGQLLNKIANIMCENNNGQILLISPTFEEQPSQIFSDALKVQLDKSDINVIYLTPNANIKSDIIAEEGYRSLFDNNKICILNEYKNENKFSAYYESYKIKH